MFEVSQNYSQLSKSDKLDHLDNVDEELLQSQNPNI